MRLSEHAAPAPTLAPEVVCHNEDSTISDPSCRNNKEIDPVTPYGSFKSPDTNGENQSSSRCWPCRYLPQDRSTILAMVVMSISAFT